MGKELLEQVSNQPLGAGRAWAENERSVSRGRTGMRRRRMRSREWERLENFVSALPRQRVSVPCRNDSALEK